MLGIADHGVFRAAIGLFLAPHEPGTAACPVCIGFGLFCAQAKGPWIRARRRLARAMARAGGSFQTAFGIPQ